MSLSKEKQTKKIYFDQHWPHRTCGYKNRKKTIKLINKTLQQGAIGSYIGFNFIKEKK